MSTQRFITHLGEIADMFYQCNDQWRGFAFTKAINEVAKLDEIEFTVTGNLATKIKGVGKAIQDVLEQFNVTESSEKYRKLKLRVAELEEKNKRFDAELCKAKVTELLLPLTNAGIDWDFAGSMRRGSDTVKDVDVVVCLHDETHDRNIVNAAIEAAGLEADVRNGQEKVGVSVPIGNGNNVTLDLNFCHPENRGAMYLYFTGPKAYNITQRGHVKKLGLRLNQHGLWKGKKLVAGKTEQEIFDALELQYVKPSERT